MSLQTSICEDWCVVSKISSLQKRIYRWVGQRVAGRLDSRPSCVFSRHNFDSTDHLIGRTTFAGFNLGLIKQIEISDRIDRAWTKDTGMCVGRCAESKTTRRCDVFCLTVSDVTPPSNHRPKKNDLNKRRYNDSRIPQLVNSLY